MSRSHEGKVAAVFGASFGMGRASAVALAQRGATIAASGRTAEALADVVGEIRAAGGEAEAFSADVEDPKQARAALAAITDRFGRIDILVYATGTNIPGRAADILSETDWDMMQRTNISGLYHTVQAALESLRESKARVVVISSAAVQMPDASGVAYQATKHAQVGFTHGLMQEEAANGIRTTVIFPGLTNTRLVEKRPVPTPKEVLDQALMPEDVAEAVVFVTSLPSRAYVPELLLFPAAIQQR